VLARLQDNESEFLLELFTTAQLKSFRHEPFRFPLEVTEPLVYLLGACVGDGTLNPHQVRICDGHHDYMLRLHEFTAKVT
jgi:hypothetical protein